MTTLAGLLTISDIDTTLNSVGRGVIIDAVNQLTAAQEEESRRMVATFVQTPDTTKYSERYFLPGGGMMQPRTRNGVPDAVKLSGANDVAYDLLDYADALGSDDVTSAYMTVGQYDANVQNIFHRYMNTVRYQVLRHLLNPTNATWIDEINGTLTIKRLANGDADVFYPVIGASAGATENHYLESGYAASAISDTNNPYVTIRAELREHWGDGNVVVFINSAQAVKTEALTDFTPISERFVQPGVTADQVIGSPGAVPGSTLGRASGVWVVEWDYIPANYMLAIDIDQPAPLKRRVDVPAELRGFKLAGDLEKWPISVGYWRAREGYGVANRLNGVVMELGSGGTYTTPSAYA